MIKIATSRNLRNCLFLSIAEGHTTPTQPASQGLAVFSTLLVLKDRFLTAGGFLQNKGRPAVNYGPNLNTGQRTRPEARPFLPRISSVL